MAADITGGDRIITAASMIMRAELYPCGNGCPAGVLHSRYLDAPYEFDNILQMIWKMEEIFDVKGFPDAYLAPKSFKAAPGSTYEYGGSRGADCRPTADTADKKTAPAQNGHSHRHTKAGGKLTFEITVKYRQNATWQGQILWAERGLRQNFRSVLEMLRLIREAAAEAAE